jgi:peptidoglycan/xylan/chitin deacetylase (PgdA/CDA1 family)
MSTSPMIRADSWFQDGSMLLREVPLVLMYHGIAQVAEDPNKLCVTPRRFAEQMAWLARSGLQGVGMGTLLDAMRAGRHARMVGITFDDGYVNVAEAALPVLQSHGFGATAFIISGLLGRTNEWDEGPAWPLMSADQVRALSAAGIEIGSHSATHVRMAGLDQASLSAEATQSRSALAGVTGAEIGGFAYPYGSMDDAAIAAVGAAGYSYACAVTAPRASIGPMALPRMFVGERDGPARMLAKRLLFRSHVTMRGGTE